MLNFEGLPFEGAQLFMCSAIKDSYIALKPDVKFFLSRCISCMNIVKLDVNKIAKSTAILFTYERGLMIDRNTSK